MEFCQYRTRPMKGVYTACLCAPVSSKALKGLLENDGRGTYRDTHPWLVAKEILAEARKIGEQLPILFATTDTIAFSHWAFVEALDVIELHRATWESALRFSPLKPVNPIWEPLDSLLLMPSTLQLRRESLEGIHQHRYPLTNGELHPYAICETPAFIAAESRQAATGVSDTP